MENVKDRRSFERMAIPGMKAVLVNNYFYYLFSFRFLYNIIELIFRKIELINISLTGACLLSKQNFEPGQSVHMIISVPGMSKIPVTGSVRWSTNASDQEAYMAGIQFMAFNKGKRYNSFKRLKQINELMPQPATATATEKN